VIRAANAVIPTAHADLLSQQDQFEAAVGAYERALTLCGNTAESAYLQRRLSEG